MLVGIILFEPYIHDIKLGQNPFHCSAWAQAKTKALAQSRTLNLVWEPPTHLPETFWRVLGIVGGQDLVCRLPIVQGTSTHSFDPPPLTLSLVEGGTESSTKVQSLFKLNTANLRLVS